MKTKRPFRRFFAWCVLRKRWVLRVSHDNVSKHIFEHVRNLGLCALVLGAGHFELQRPIADGGLFHWLAVGFFFGFGSLLYLLNMLNGYVKLKTAGVNKHILLSWGNYYSLFTFVIINSVMRL